MGFDAQPRGEAHFLGYHNLAPPSSPFHRNPRRSHRRCNNTRPSPTASACRPCSRAGQRRSAAARRRRRHTAAPIDAALAWHAAPSRDRHHSSTVWCAHGSAAPCISPGRPAPAPQPAPAAPARGQRRSAAARRRRRHTAAPQRHRRGLFRTFAPILTPTFIPTSRNPFKGHGCDSIAYYIDKRL